MITKIYLSIQKIYLNILNIFTILTIFLICIGLLTFISISIINPTLLKTFICFCIFILLFIFYKIVILEDHACDPYYLNMDQQEEIKKITSPEDSDLIKTRKIFNWMQKNISYEHSSLNEQGEFKNRYRLQKNAYSVMKTRNGVCIDLAILYVAIARYSGIKSVFVAIVDFDKYGNVIFHACAIYKTDKSEIQIDPAYQEYNINHKGYKIVSDFSVIFKLY